MDGQASRGLALSLATLSARFDAAEEMLQTELENALTSVASMTTSAAATASASALLKVKAAADSTESSVRP